jgi:hypothetical protein
VKPSHIFGIATKNEEKSRVELTEATESFCQSFALIQAESGGNKPVGRAIGHASILGLRARV